MWLIANEDPLGIVHSVQPEGSYVWDGPQMTPYLKKEKISCQSGANLPPIKRLGWMGHT